MDVPSFIKKYVFTNYHKRHNLLHKPSLLQDISTLELDIVENSRKLSATLIACQKTHHASRVTHEKGNKETTKNAFPVYH